MFVTITSSYNNPSGYTSELRIPQQIVNANEYKFVNNKQRKLVVYVFGCNLFILPPITGKLCIQVYNTTTYL